MDIIYKHDISRNIGENYFSLHTHPCFEIFFMMKGNGVFVVEGHEYSLQPNCLILLRPGEMHRAKIESGCDYERCFLHFSDDTVRAFDPDGELLFPFTERLIGERNFYSSADIDGGFVKGLLARCEKELSREGGCDLSHHLFLLLNEIRGAFYSEDKDGSQTSADSLIYEIIRYINENICSEQSVGAIEKMFYISRPILNKRFKRATGTTVWDYIITKRVVLADQMMSSGESATQAAYACGYNDYSSFYRAYKKVFGHPPKVSL